MLNSPERGARRRWRAVVKWMALGLAVVLVLAVVAVVVRYRSLPGDHLATLEPGELSVADDAEGTFRSGRAEVEVTGSGVEVRFDDATAWSSVPQEAFLAATAGELEVEEHRGYFWVGTEHDRVWRDQTIAAVEVDAGAVVLRGRLGSREDALGYTLRLTGSATAVDFEVEVADAADSVTLFSGRTTGAGVHGFGEQFTDFDLDGRVLPLLVREQGVGRGEQPLTFLADLTNHGAGGTDQMTYAAWATYVTEDLRGLTLDPEVPQSHAVGIADLSDPDRVGLELRATRMVGRLTAAATPGELVARTSGPADAPGGRLPRWSQEGLIVGAQGGSEAVRRKVTSLQEAGVDVAGVWIQDWVGQRTTDFGQRLWWTWQVDRELYPDWEELIAGFAEEGIRTTTYVNPFVVDPATKPGVTDDPGFRDLFAEARERGYLVTRDGEPYPLDQGGFDAYLIDLSDPAAREWFAGVIAEEVLAADVRGFMADFGEGLPFDAELASGDAELLHNRWPDLWAQTVGSACGQAATGSDCLTWFRSGGLGSRHRLAWNGDQMVDFAVEDGLASTLLGTFSAGVSGWPVVHSDLGGYTSIDAVVRKYRRSPELLQRWAELAAFGPVMRSHEGNRPAQNLQLWDEAGVRDHLARMTQVFAALAPYRRAVLREAARTGVPYWRHGWLVAPGTSAANTDRQVFVGQDVLVAPVLEEGGTEVEVVLPDGEWRHLLTGERYDGGTTVTVDAPLGNPAVLVRAESPWAARLLARMEAVEP
ncbi:alpha-glucosidase [Nocardioides sp. BGMRC 2183]|nr:alpha-glucosidase [Nocardioides sp. BGMRC 2183]